jgi:hypothetical protein
LPTKISELGIRKQGNFEERPIGASGVIDKISGVTLEQHVNDETIHAHEDEFAAVAFTGDYINLANKPDLANLHINGGSF